MVHVSQDGHDGLANGSHRQGEEFDDIRLCAFAMIVLASPSKALDSARLLPCARRQRRQVVEGTHHIIAEGTGLEPYSPCQSLVRGQGGLEDVHACVDLPVHIAARRAFAKRTSIFETRWSRWRTRSRSLTPSRPRRVRWTRRSLGFFRAIRRRLLKWIA